MFWLQKSDFRVLYSGFAPWGPCIRPKSPISGFCIRGLPPGGHVFAPKVRFPGFVSAVCPIGAMYSPKLLLPTTASNFQPETAWLACLLCPALAWSGLGLSCLPCLPCQACLPCLGLFQQQQPPWEGGVAGNKQWKKEIVDKSWKNISKILKNDISERSEEMPDLFQDFLRFFPSLTE